MQNVVRFYKAVYQDNKQRVSGKRNILADIKQYYKNRLLQPFELKLYKKYYSEDYPLIFIVGVPRSGTTVLSQLMTTKLEIGVLSNKMARYWMVPLWALSRFGNSKDSNSNGIDLKSDLGNTEGDSNPHEFGYFWQFHLNHKTHDELTKNEFYEAKVKRIKKALNSIATFYQKPLLVKSIVYTNYQIQNLKELFPNSKFIYIKRDPAYCMQSIYESRIKRYGSPEIWWSIRPRNIEDIRAMSPAKQIAYQYCHVSSRIESGLNSISESDKLIISYEDLMTDNTTVIDLIAEKFGLKIISKQEIKLNEFNKTRIDRKVFDLMEYECEILKRTEF